MTTNDQPQKSGGLDRRDFLKFSGAGLGVLSMLPVQSWLGKANLAHGAPLIGEKRMAIINLYGGNDGLNTVVPTTLNRYYDRRPSISIADANGLSLAGAPGGAANGLYKLHPNLTQIQALYNEGSVAIINKVGYPDMNGSHFLSQDIWSFGARNGGNSGWPARFSDMYAATSAGVVGIGIGNRRDFVGGQSTKPLVMSSTGSFRFDSDGAHSSNHVLRRSVIENLLADQRLDINSETVRVATQQAIDLQALIDQAESDYSSAVVYQNEQLSNRMKDLAVMIQGGFETKLFYTGFGGFDTHGDQANRHADRMQRLDDAIGSFAADMKAMGTWNDVAIVVISEFGRRCFENGSAGTDHGRGNCMFVIGGAVQGGVYGDDITNSDLDNNNVGYEVDFRTVYKDVIENHMGLDPDPLFPEALEKNANLGGLFT